MNAFCGGILVSLSMHQHNLYPCYVSWDGRLPLKKYSFEGWSIFALQNQALQEQREPNSPISNHDNPII